MEVQVPSRVLGEASQAAECAPKRGADPALAAGRAEGGEQRGEKGVDASGKGFHGHSFVRE
jgi:hypothetical protein